MNDLTIFKNDRFGEIRTTVKDSTVLFCAKDIAAALGYSNPRDALAKHCKGVAKCYPLETGGGIQNIRFIPESDVYRLVFGSKLPDAEKFTDWVTEEVLPTIRKTGGYVNNASQFVDSYFPQLRPDQKQAIGMMLDESKRMGEKIAADAPKVLFADAVSTAKTSILVGELAKLLKQNGVEIGQNRLFDWLRNRGYLIRRQGSDYNMPTQKAMEMGLFEIKETSVVHADGHTSISKTPKITGRGQCYFVDKLLGKATS